MNHSLGIRPHQDSAWIRCAVGFSRAGTADGMGRIFRRAEYSVVCLTGICHEPSISFVVVVRLRVRK